jgi:betaine-aldehyde dehydrogenase
MHEIRNPATLEPLGSVPDCGPEHVAGAVATARAAQSAWCNVPAADRALFVGEIGARIRARAPELAVLLTRESGKPLCESIDCIDAVVAVFAACAARGPSDQPPAGVVAAIVPFNFPLLMMAAAIAPAIAAGNALVCKPPRQNLLTSIMLAEAFGALPAGIVNIVTGGPDTGRALVDHPDVGLVAFTGSAAVGQRIAAAAPPKRITLELGGVDGFIVCEDADLDVAVPGIAWSRLMNGGQVCTLGKHIYVARSIIAEFVERMHYCVGFLDVDDPMKPATDLGPLISLEAAHRVEDQVGRALREGATLILGGRRFRPSGLPGHFFQPTILTNVRPGSVPTREEIQGPVITITPVADLAAAVGLASESGSSVGASIYTRDPEAAIKALACFDVGLFRINDPVAGTSAGPFGGMRHRGIHRILDNEPADAIWHPRQVQVAKAMEPKPWWFPYLARKVAAGRTVGSRPIS